MPSDKPDIYEWISQELRHRQITRNDLAEAIGVHSSKVSRALARQANFTTKQLMQLKEYFGDAMPELSKFETATPLFKAKPPTAETTHRLTLPSGTAMISYPKQAGRAELMLLRGWLVLMLDADIEDALTD